MHRKLAIALSFIKQHLRSHSFWNQKPHRPWKYCRKRGQLWTFNNSESGRLWVGMWSSNHAPIINAFFPFQGGWLQRYGFQMFVISDTVIESSITNLLEHTRKSIRTILISVIFKNTWMNRTSQNPNVQRTQKWVVLCPREKIAVYILHEHWAQSKQPN